ncbi:chemotaxis protein CheB [Acidovorax sp. SUPP950]|uniref:chemotaxis protein CheB n=1 Tax=unclassified Acidovorax TaxID=2684926 RepID=UPI0023BBC027|nr:MULTISPECIES: chemotaxis protein CheB [Comamonadaceae]WOI44105.1 chemotaxis protein CheB [Paracidovorax avenae]GKS75354.1 chemotaxis protein CheB [Acidovorax sp. SUPP950]GKS98771.1 chemotaxis protein CheB [Acidovorax sp. SUPP3434]
MSDRIRPQAVVIGGSAGSIEALSVLLPALPSGLRAAVFVVLHLPRERPSLLCEIFQPSCAVPLREAQDKEPVEPGTVYFAPPDYHLLIDAGPSLALSVDDPVHFSRPSIDVLFESAADAYGERLLGILLSGANSDGAQGLAAVQAAGGTTVVQDPDSAPMPFMPEAAMSACTPGHVLSPQRIASLLETLFHRRAS